MIITKENTDRVAGMFLTARRKKGLILEEGARRSGLTKTTVSALELGQSEPRLYTLVSMAEALGLEVEIREKRG